MMATVVSIVIPIIATIPIGAIWIETIIATIRIIRIIWIKRRIVVIVVVGSAIRRVFAIDRLATSVVAFIFLYLNTIRVSIFVIGTLFGFRF
jgi:hypothetical protein